MFTKLTRMLIKLDLIFETIEKSKAPYEHARDNLIVWILLQFSF
jgi:hypothetical protein